MCWIACIDCAHVRQSLIPGNKAILVMVHDLITVLNLVCKAFPTPDFYLSLAGRLANSLLSWFSGVVYGSWLCRKGIIVPFRFYFMVAVWGQKPILLVSALQCVELRSRLLGTAEADIGEGRCYIDKYSGRDNIRSTSLTCKNMCICT